MIGCGLICIIGVICLACGGCGIALVTGGVEYSDGFREGRVQKFSYKGVIWKTQEGEMALPGWKSSGSETMSNVFEFSVDKNNEPIIQQITNLHADDEVRLHYKQYWFVPPWRGNTEYYIVKVEKIKETKP